MDSYKLKESQQSQEFLQILEFLHAFEPKKLVQNHPQQKHGLQVASLAHNNNMATTHLEVGAFVDI